MGTLDSGNIGDTLDTNKPISTAHKDAVKLASTANVVFASALTVDSITLSVSDRVLLKNQCTGAVNGIYNVNTLSVKATGTVTAATALEELTACGTVTTVCVVACDTVTFNGLVYTAVCGAKANDTEFSICTSNCAVATDLADSIDDDTRCGTLNDATATAACNVVTIVSDTTGSGSNAMTLVSSCATTLLTSAATLTGGNTADIATINGLIYTAVAGARANDTQFSTDTSDCATATDLAAAVTADTRCGTLNDVTATSASAVVTLTTSVSGTAGNCTTLTSSDGTTLAVSGACFTGGVDGVWTRSLDFDENSEVKAGTVVMVEKGTVNADTAWQLTTDNDITVGTTAQTWTAFAPSSISSCLADGNILVGNACAVATSVNPSGDIDVTNAGVFSISSGVILNADVNACAAIALSKLAGVAAGNIVVGSCACVPTSVNPSGDVDITCAGVFSIASGVVVNADINACAAIAFSKLAALTDGNILVGNGSNVAVSVNPSGDVDVSNAGVFSISSGVIINADINACAAIAYSKIQDVSATNVFLGRDSACAGVIEEIAASAARTILNVECGSTADQSNAEIKTAYEANACTNEFSCAEQTKLCSIECAADVTDITNINTALADNAKLLFGACDDSSIVDTGSGMIIDFDEQNAGCKTLTVQSDATTLFTVNDVGLGIGVVPTLHTLEIVGHVGVCRTATATDQHAFDIVADAAGNGDFKATEVEYTTGCICTGQNDAVHLVEVIETCACGGEVSALEVLSCSVGCADIFAITTGVNVNIIQQNSGTFCNASSILNCVADVLAALSCGGAGNITMFACNSDTVTVGSCAKFEEMEFIICTPASGGGVAPTFEFSTAGCGWTSFTPVDGTNGLKNTGEILWEDADIPTWAVHSCEFKIRITRTRVTLGTKPVVDLVQIAASTLYTWNKCGNLAVNVIDALDIETATVSARDGSLAITIANCTGVSTFVSGAVFVAPALGTPASGVATNLTGTAASLTAGTVTTNANLTGDVTSSGNATTIAANAVHKSMICACGKTESIIIAASDETTALTAACGVVTFRMPYAFTLTGIRASIGTAGSTCGNLTVDVNDGGTTIMTCDKLVFDTAEKTTTTATTAPTLTDTALADDAEITVDIDAITGGGTEAGLKVTLIGYQT